MQKRLLSLDVLRGLDIFFLVVLYPVVNSLEYANNELFSYLIPFFLHSDWNGFSFWDIVMPLFMFMSGVTIPYSLGKYRDKSASYHIYLRLVRRVILLWLIGMMIQGNLLGFDPNLIFIYTNVLQAIAVGYFVSSLLYLNVSVKSQICVAILLLLTYWGIMEFVTINGYGGGDYTPQRNLAEYVDRAVLGRFRDCARVIDGKVVFLPSYTNTWILSSLNFVVTILSGLFAGEILRSTMTNRRKLWLMFGLGVAWSVAGWILDMGHPVNKRIWTSSFTLVSSGYCMLLMWLFYYWIDCCGHKKFLVLFMVYGMNSITAYGLTEIPNVTKRLSMISDFALHFSEPYVGGYYQVMITASNVLLIFLLLNFLYRKKLFIRL